MTIDTWIVSVNRLFTERHFQFGDSDGNIIGYARSLWASIDLETRKPTNLLELYGLSGYIHPGKECPTEGLTKIPALKDNYEIAGGFIVKYSDVDINKHLNSMKYIEHFVDIFDIEMFRDKEIRRIEVNYISEGHYGSKLDRLKREEEDSVFVLEMRDGDTNVCSARVAWN
jgi:acyl-ACP thioesterase